MMTIENPKTPKVGNHAGAGTTAYANKGDSSDLSEASSDINGILSGSLLTVTQATE